MVTTECFPTSASSSWFHSSVHFALSIPERHHDWSMWHSALWVICLVSALQLCPKGQSTERSPPQIVLQKKWPLKEGELALKDSSIPASIMILQSFQLGCCFIQSSITPSDSAAIEGRVSITCLLLWMILQSDVILVRACLEPGAWPRESPSNALCAWRHQ